MPRDGGGVYSFPSGGAAVSGETIVSSAYNTRWADILSDLNAARPISAGGTGASTAAAARTALGAQSLDALLTAIAALTTSADGFIYTTGSDTVAVAAFSSAARTMVAQATQADMRTTGLGLGTIATQAANNVAITGGTVAARPVLGAETSGTLTAVSANRVLQLSGGITAPASVFTALDTMILDPGGSGRTVTRGSGLTMLVSASDSASATIAANTIASLYYRSATVAILSGPGVST